MNLRLRRIMDNGDETIGALYLQEEEREKFLCWTLEDQNQAKKVYAETRIPAGTYEIKLRNEGRIHENYKQKFPEMHKGTLWLQNVPGFQFILIHIGNTDKDTAGCILVGSGLNAVERAQLVRSTAAYIKIYQIIQSAIEKEKTFITIID